MTCSQKKLAITYAYPLEGKSDPSAIKANRNAAKLGEADRTGGDEVDSEENENIPEAEKYFVSFEVSAE